MKVKLQTFPHLYRGTFQCFTNTWRTEGVGFTIKNHTNTKIVKQTSNAKEKTTVSSRAGKPYIFVLVIPGPLRWIDSSSGGKRVREQLPLCCQGIHAGQIFLLC